tara:strand:+ start:233 stop:571 length:339 start_codon:yes stop_codon:yes gene_type:complete
MGRDGGKRFALPYHLAAPCLLLRRRLLTGNRTSLALVRPRIGASALTTDRKAAPVPQPTIAAYIHKALDIHRTLGPERPFHLEIPFDLATKTIHIIVTYVLSPSVRIHPTSI